MRPGVISPIVSFSKKYTKKCIFTRTSANNFVLIISNNSKNIMHYGQIYELSYLYEDMFCTKIKQPSSTSKKLIELIIWHNKSQLDVFVRKKQNIRTVTNC